MEKNIDTKKKRVKKKNDVETSNEPTNKDMTPNIQVFIEDEIITDEPNSSSEHLRCSRLEPSLADPLPNTVEALSEPAKKRGRKPKGGKLTLNCQKKNEAINSIAHIILHLKCSIKDLDSTNLFGSNLDSYSFSNQNNLVYDNIGENKNINFNEYTNISEKITDYDVDNDNNTIESENPNNDIRDVWKKLKLLEYKLHNNCIDNKKSACFWDTCEFDNPPIYIIKHFMNDTYHVYGCFCSPECAVAYLMKENIDSSIKFERYYLMNHVYSKVFNYNKNIKPAPDPFYMLEKFYGNLNIQEYRSLLRNERLFLVVDKPLTRIMPELHEDNDDFIINNKIIPSNTYQIKKKLQKKLTKKNILNERFGLSQS